MLEEIAKAFEEGKIYSEREVNIIIADFHDDFCTIRRDMISEGLMTRMTGGIGGCLNPPSTLFSSHQRFHGAEPAFRVPLLSPL